jgi:hypothetical protein
LGLANVTGQVYLPYSVKAWLWTYFIGIVGLMARNPKQKALYEVIKSSQKRLDSKGIRPAASVDENTDSSESTRTPAITETEIQRGVQGLGRQLLGNLDRRRVLLIPYRVAAILTLVFILVVLAAFRLGQMSDEQTAATADFEFARAENEDAVPVITAVEKTSESAELEKAPAGAEEQLTTVSKGDNVIVIASYRNRSNLEPVQEYFARNGIETEIWLRNNYFYMVTKEMFEGTERRGSKGYLMKEKIKKIGADYKAPSGYESFKPNLFQDAYGMKVE